MLKHGKKGGFCPRSITFGRYPPRKTLVNAQGRPRAAPHGERRPQKRRRGAFARTQIKEVVIPEGVETLEADVFSRCPLEKIFFLPTGVVDMSLSFSSPFPYMYDATVYLPEGAADSDLYSSWTSHFGTVELLSDEEMGVMLGIGGVAADGQRPGAPYYTLGGVKVGEPLRPGLYISRGKKVLVK